MDTQKFYGSHNETIKDVHFVICLLFYITHGWDSLAIMIFKEVSEINVKTTTVGKLM